MLMTTWKATSESAFSTGSGPLSGPKPLTMASMEIAPAVSDAAQAPDTPKRTVAQPNNGSGAYSSSGVRSGLSVGRKNSSAHTARMVSDSVMAFGRPFDRNRALSAAQPLGAMDDQRHERHHCESIGDGAGHHGEPHLVGDAEQHEGRRHEDAGEGGSDQAAEQHQREGAAHPVEAMRSRGDGQDRECAQRGEPDVGDVLGDDLRERRVRAAARTGGTARWPRGTSTSVRAARAAAHP